MQNPQSVLSKQFWLSHERTMSIANFLLHYQISYS